MIAKFFLVALLFALAGFCMNTPNSRKALAPAPKNSLAVNENSTPASSLLTFEGDILPILKNNCNPCHFPGGTMYARMPFDQPATLISHSEKMLKRIKKEEEVEKIRQFLSQSSQKDL